MSLLVCIALMVNTAQAGTSAIQGFVYDDSGDVVAGATVTIKSTGHVCSSDESGWYAIQVGSGIYEVAADVPDALHGGRSNVVVMEDEPTRVDITLQRYVVCDPLPVVFLSGSVPGMPDVIPLELRIADGTGDLIRSGPGVLDNGVRNGSIKFISAGCRNPQYVQFSTMDAPVEDHLHVRGGRRGELLYMVDGYSYREPVYNSILGTVPVSSLKEIDLSAGVYDTRFGNFLSGAVGMETIEGGEEYSGEIRMEGNDWHALGLADEGTWGGIPEDFPLESFDPWSYSEVTSFNEARLEFGGSIGGPEPISTYLLPGIGLMIPGEMRLFIDGEFLETGGGKDGRYGFGFDDWETTFRGFLKLSYKPSVSTDIDFTTSFLERSAGWFRVGDYWNWSRYEFPYIDRDPSSPTYGDTLGSAGNILYALPVRSWSNRHIGARINHEFSDITMVSLCFAQQKADYDHRIYNDPESTNPMRQTEWLGEDWSWEDWENYQPGIVTDFEGFIHGGTSRFPWRESRSTTNTIDLDTQILAWEPHDISWGIQGDFYDVYSYSVVVDNAPSSTVHQNMYNAEPLSGSVYLQDRVSLEDGMTLTGGLRLDYFDANYNRMPYPLEIPPPPTLQNQVLDWIQAPPKYSVNPRFSFILPLTESHSLHAAYGMYSQVPVFELLYHMEDHSFSQSIPLGGNPDLDLQKTTMYELGTFCSLTHRICVDVTGYFKEMSNLVETDIFTCPGIGQYAQYVSTGTGESRGLEVSLKGKDAGFFSWDVSYTLSRATGSSSHPLQNYIYVLNGYQNSDAEQYLDWDQTHTVDLDLTMQVPRGRGLRIGGVPVFQGLGVGLEWEFGSGFPYSLANQGTAQPAINSERYPLTMETNLKVSKDLWLENFSMNLWCEVTNLFDRHNTVDIQDIAWYCAWQSAGGDEKDEDPTGPLHNYYALSMPRMIRFGLGVSW